jgi:phosphosulfolactate phosphohydrolase-like enzyme
MSDPRTQPQYQIRFDWGYDGAVAITRGAHILVWVDALVSEGPVDASRITEPCAIVAGTVGNRDEVARWVLDRQVELGDRATVAVVAAGGADGRFAVEDLLAAGAIIDALAEVGIDYISPEAAAAVGAFTGLRNATSHVLSASVSGQTLMAERGREFIDEAKLANSERALNVLREFVHSA